MHYGFNIPFIKYSDCSIDILAKFTLLNRTITDWNNLIAVTMQTFSHNVNIFIRTYN
jgi:hypothetical protein